LVRIRLTMVATLAAGEHYQYRYHSSIRVSYAEHAFSDPDRRAWAQSVGGERGALYTPRAERGQ
jgi:hypothetical protein